MNTFSFQSSKIIPQLIWTGRIKHFMLHSSCHTLRKQHAERFRSMGNVPPCPSGEPEWMGRFRIRSAGEGLHPTESRGEEDTDAALIPLINTEWLEAGESVRFPRTETPRQPRMKFGAARGGLADKPAICEISRTNVLFADHLHNFPAASLLMEIRNSLVTRWNN